MALTALPSSGQNLSLRTGTYIVISFTNTPEQDYEVLASTNVAGPYQFVGEIYGNPSGVYSFTNFPDPNAGQMYYRTVTGSGGTDSVVVSLDGSSPLAGNVGVNNTTEGQYLGLPVLVFDVSAGNEDVHLHSVTVNVNTNGSGLVVNAFLYQGSTPIASTTVINGVATFSGIADVQAGTTIPAGTTVPYTVKVDVYNLTGPNVSETVSASTGAAGIIVYDQSDSPVSVSGMANGNTQTVVGNGAWFSLASSPQIQSQNISPGGATNTTILYTATFNVNVMAVGESVVLGLPSSSNPAFGGSNTGTNYVQLYEDILAAQNNGGLQIIASYSQPSSTTLSADGTSFTLEQNQAVTIPVTYKFVVTNPGGNIFSLGMVGIDWSVNGQQETTAVGSSGGWKTGSE